MKKITSVGWKRLVQEHRRSIELGCSWWVTLRYDWLILWRYVL